MTDVAAKMKKRLASAGLPCPSIPEKLAVQLRELDRWCFSTRSLRLSPYAFHNFLREASAGVVDDYAILAQAGHGVNSHALHYYLNYEPLALFLQLHWGGVYADENECRDNIKKCFFCSASA